MNQYEKALERIKKNVIPSEDWTEDDLSHLKAVTNALEKQIPKKPYFDNDNGVYEKGHCPTCHRSLFPRDNHCLCGQCIDWKDDGNNGGN